MPEKPIKITDDNLNDNAQKYKILIVDCWAEWCPPCKMMLPIIDELANEFKGKIVFGKLDVNENKVAPANYNVSGIPTLLIFKDGKHVDSIVGLKPKDNLIEYFNKLLSN